MDYFGEDELEQRGRVEREVSRGQWGGRMTVLASLQTPAHQCIETQDLPELGSLSRISTRETTLRPSGLSFFIAQVWLPTLNLSTWVFPRGKITRHWFPFIESPSLLVISSPRLQQDYLGQCAGCFLR